MHFDFELLHKQLNAMIFECALCTVFDSAAVFYRDVSVVEFCVCEWCMLVEAAPLSLYRPSL